MVHISSFGVYVADYISYDKERVYVKDADIEYLDFNPDDKDSIVIKETTQSRCF